MAVMSYVVDGRTFWRVYVNMRARTDSSIRIQRRAKDLETEHEAIALEKKLIREVTQELMRTEGKGVTWEDLVDRWQSQAFQRLQGQDVERSTAYDYVHLIRKWTGGWMARRASDISRHDARETLQEMETEGLTRWSQEKFRSAVNAVFKWGIDEGLVRGVNSSPVYALQPTIKRHEKVPEILNLAEIRELLRVAREQDHPWYPVWAMALMTGMRNGELYALLWDDIDVTNRRISVNKAYQSKGKFIKSTKNGEWRTVPMSDELVALLNDLRATTGDRKEVLPRFGAWNKGEQARVLRQFCKSVGVKAIRFHSLRACFATQLLAHDVAPARVMKICGWKDLKTMQHYIRVAGIEEEGATDALQILRSTSS